MATNVWSFLHQIIAFWISSFTICMVRKSSHCRSVYDYKSTKKWVMTYNVNELGQYWFRQWIGVCLPEPMSNWTGADPEEQTAEKFEWKNFIFHENAFGNVAPQVSAILVRREPVNSRRNHLNTVWYIMHLEYGLDFSLRFMLVI